MSEHKDKLSAFVDDALAQEEVDSLISLKQETSDNQAGLGVLSRYHMIGEALRGQVSDVSLTDISSQVRNAIQNEAAHSVTIPSSKASTHSLIDTVTDWMQSFARPLTGLAVAASVAMVMVVALSPSESDSPGLAVVAQDKTPVNDSQSKPATSLIANTVNAPAIAVPVNASSSAQAPQLQPAVNLDAYMNEHNEFAAQGTMQGRLPYARTMARPVGYVSE